MRNLTQKQLSSERLYQGHVLGVRRDRVEMPDGKDVERIVVDHAGAVAIVPVTADGKVLLVRQWRYPANQALLEVPAGALEKGEDPEAAAARELQEEVGFRPGRLTKLTSFYTAPGYCTEKIHLYLAQDLTPSRLPGDDDEDIEVEEMTVSEALKLPEVECDAKTHLALLLVSRLMPELA